MKFYAALLSLIFATVVGPFVDDASAQNRILVTPANQNLFLFLGGKLDLACHRPVGASQTLFGEMERVTNPDGTITRTFVVRTEGEIKKLQNKYAVQIKALQKQLKEARGRDARGSLMRAIRQKLKARQALFKEARAAIMGCGPFAPGNSYTARPLDADDIEQDPLPQEEDLTFSHSLFPMLAENVDGSIRLDPSSESLVFYVSCLGNDAHHGLNPDNPVRTFAQAFSLLQQASGDGFTDHQIRLERGCSYSDELLFISGRNRETPYVIGDYGPTALPPPLMTRPVRITGALRNIAITGLDFYNAARDPASPSFNPNAPDLVAVDINGAVNRVLVQLSNFRSYTIGISIKGPVARGSHWARRVASIRNNFVDLYAKNGQLGGSSNGVVASNLRGLHVSGCLFARIGNPLSLSSEQGNTGGTGLPVIVPDLNAIAIDVGPIADSYVVLRDNQFIQGYTGIKVSGYTTDQFGQLDGTLGNLEISDNVFYENSYGVAVDAPVATVRNNAFVRGIRHGAAPFVSAMLMKNVSSLDISNNVLMNSLSDLHGRDRGIHVYGHANFAYHKIVANKLHHWPGGFLIGQLTWYDGIWVRSEIGGRKWVPMHHTPQSILWANNYINNIDSTVPLIEVARWGRGINELIFRNNTLWNPSLNGLLWSAEEHGRITEIENVYAPLPSYCDPMLIMACSSIPNFSGLCDSCLNPTCLYSIVSRTPSLRMSTTNWYATVGASLIQNSVPYPIIASTADTLTVECPNDLVVGQNHYVNVFMNRNRWYQYINRGGGEVNELPGSNPQGLHVTPITYFQPDRDLISFMATNNIRLRDANGLRPATTVADYIEYVTNFWRHAPNEDTSVDPRVAGRNVANYFRAGLNVVAP